MPEKNIVEVIETATLILQVDAGRAAADPFKLSAALAALVTARKADAAAKNAAAVMIEGSTVGASVQRHQALTRLGELLRNGYNGIRAANSEDLPADQRAQVFEDYGWTGGHLGDLESPLRIESLAMLAATATADPNVPEGGKYPPALVGRIANWLATFEAASMIANGGDRQTLVAVRNAARDLLEKANARVRYWYCQASDETDFTPELAKIGMQPRRHPGDAQPQPRPDAPGAAAFDAVARTLTVPGLPAHASFLRAYRQPAGGPAEACGVSNTATVSVVGTGPLTPGVVYEVWVVGVNSRGEGPESNKVSFTA